jgi:hypothetical protein
MGTRHLYWMLTDHSFAMYLRVELSLMTGASVTRRNSDCVTCTNIHIVKKNRGFYNQGVTKRCRLSLLTNSALVDESQCGGGGGCGVSANEYSCAHHVTWSPNKLRRSTIPQYLPSFTTVKETHVAHPLVFSALKR